MDRLGRTSRRTSRRAPTPPRSQRAGGLPLILPPDDAERRATRAQLLELLDGLILSGGADIDPAGYGAEPAPADRAATAPERDSFELALARAALERDLPVLGICRGHADAQRRPRRHARAASATTARRSTCTRPGASPTTRSGSSPARWPRARPAAERIAVRSHHHQGVGELGAGLVASAWAEPDGLVEAIEVPGPPLRARGALAPRGGRGQPGDRRAGRGARREVGRRA